MIIAIFSFSTVVEAAKSRRNIKPTTKVETLPIVTQQNKQNQRFQRIVKYATDAEAAQAAIARGYVRTNFLSKGNAVFKKDSSYITRDTTAHSGGVWKEASSPEALASKNTRNATLDVDFNKIGD